MNGYEEPTRSCRIELFMRLSALRRDAVFADDIVSLNTAIHGKLISETNIAGDLRLFSSELIGASKGRGHALHDLVGHYLVKLATKATEKL